DLAGARAPGGVGVGGAEAVGHEPVALVVGERPVAGLDPVTRAVVAVADRGLAGAGGDLGPRRQPVGPVVGVDVLDRAVEALGVLAGDFAVVVVPVRDLRDLDRGRR